MDKKIVLQIPYILFFASIVVFTVVMQWTTMNTSFSSLVSFFSFAHDNNPVVQVVQVPSFTETDKDGWRKYESAFHRFSVDYPANFEIDEGVYGEVRLSKWGPTQVANREFFDGISLTFSSDSHKGLSFEELVKEQHTMLAKVLGEDKVSQIQERDIAGVKGKTFDVQNLGTHHYIYAPLHNENYFLVIDSTADPSNQGFDEVVEQILSTVRIQSAH